jgi:hypothetical protein
MKEKNGHPLNPLTNTLRKRWWYIFARFIQTKQKPTAMVKIRRAQMEIEETKEQPDASIEPEMMSSCQPKPKKRRTAPVQLFCPQHIIPRPGIEVPALFEHLIAKDILEFEARREDKDYVLSNFYRCIYSAIRIGDDTERTDLCEAFEPLVRLYVEFESNAEEFKKKYKCA